MEEKRGALQNVTDVVVTLHGITRHKGQNGRRLRSMRPKGIVSNIKTLRYEGGEYFFVIQHGR